MFVGSWIASGVASCVSLCACQACSCMGREVMRRSARATYCILFCFAMVLAWVLRDFAEPLLERIPWIVRHHEGGSYSDKWFGMQAVYRISMGNFMFFGVMALTLLGVKYKSDNRDKFIHHGNWLVKLGVWMLFNALPFFFPNSVVLGYGWLARFGSGIFLVIQMCILLDFTQSWNDTWVAEGQDNPKYLWALLGITAGCYVGSTAVSAVLYYLWGRPVEGSEGVTCSLNILLITFTLLMCLLFSLVSISPQLAPNGSLFPSAVITLYSTYLAFSALQSEPHDYECNSMGAKESAASYSTLALGVVATLFAVTYAAFRAGSNTQAFFTGSDSDDEEALLAENQQALTSAGVDGEGEGEEALPRESNSALKEFEPVSYNYSFFHLVFALASMYIAMLMTGWGTNAAEKDFIDVGWTSVWVKISSQWATGLVYTWCLMAPVLLPDRVFT